ncbi:CHAD domain protein [Botrimarina colliarenosi]|uniref:CHAD domain protein n=1 Tax=Botrimarina colliarenosi TaxID=2528001 RepID=A0A5C6AEN3_9BACT|nr:CHAD domain-containing protein [Botrimarina colliarenosi]TWT97886.1 CHAD domain protein [Botrimarina colliarenosi]
MAYAFKRGEPLEPALRRIAAATLDEAIGRLNDGTPPETAVHETRKACKRLRALLRLYKPALGDVFRREEDAVRKAAKALSSARDQHVLLQTCERLAESQRETQLVAAIRAVGAGLNELESPTNDSTELLTATSERLADVRERVDSWRAPHPKAVIVKRFRHTYRDGRKQRRRCRLNGDAEPWHAWRKAVKQHGYQARLLAALHVAGPAYLEPWDRLGKLLGEEHDFSVLCDRLGGVGVSPEVADHVKQAAIEQRAALREEARKLGADLYRLPPKVIGNVARGLLSK